MTVPGFNGVIDISHHNTVSSIARIKGAGIVAVIHKATEGVRLDWRDKEYPGRRKKFKDAGFLWGSYHFSSGDDPMVQFQNYVSYAEPTEDEVICLDFEPSSRGRNMTYEQMLEFVELAQEHFGRYPMIYGGSMLREVLRGITQSPLSQCPLWYARYFSAPVGVPPIWGAKTWTLWQYTDGNAGPQPQTVSGIGNCDRDTFNGTQAQLQQNWPFAAGQPFVGV